nr:Chain F, C-Jun-amino-terminal kinase-interacting protein 1, JIP1, 10MER PEPTIDE [Mus musculus]3O17_G Chain G, C-Jun-amino-terminal kinase-interacting protein 1, JIP1, 10MER PEPTIDE [Mus musculus]3O2M_F Chain F, C-Jun-amino-terminal kinase-interacting protein 1, JIP1, 10MER PEPTIDE [Mus musculus]3O2M_G Chain G, C-Jun-amino-terminal kinase-interacting protein 1, JIP1, 10MER PEPTIDE [Mus musculus]3OXI_J Chain J, Mitogen-activated protein kinase 8 interacting protein 1 [Homo sapiens]4H39_B Chai
PKRPTTLNLF